MFAARPLASAVQTTTWLFYRFDRKILGLSIRLRPRLGYNNCTQESTNRPHDKHSDRGRVYAMMPIEEAIIDMLRRSGRCCLDDVVAFLPNFSWGEVFGAVDRMSRNGRVLLRQLGYSTYQIALRSQYA
jgi:hypothetical protein